MKPSFRAFSEEMFLIKCSKQEAKPSRKGMFRQALKNALVTGAAMGGAYATSALARPLIKKIVPKMLPQHVKILSLGIGGLGGMGSLLMASAMQHGDKLTEEAGRDGKS